MGMQGDEHNKNTELAKFPHLRSIDTDESRWWKSTDDGVGLITNEPGTPIEVTFGAGGAPFEIAPSDDPAYGIDGYFAEAVTTAQDVSATPGNMFYVEATNPDDAAICWLHFFNVAAASVVLGTTVPIHKMAVPMGAGASTTAGIRSESWNPFPIPFSTRLSVAVVQTFAHAGSVVVATAVPVIVRFKN
jgi:hypothetical protein